MVLGKRRPSLLYAGDACLVWLPKIWPVRRPWSQDREHGPWRRSPGSARRHSRELLLLIQMPRFSVQQERVAREYYCQRRPSLRCDRRCASWAGSLLARAAGWTAVSANARHQPPESQSEVNTGRIIIHLAARRRASDARIGARPLGKQSSGGGRRRQPGHRGAGCLAAGTAGWVHQSHAAPSPQRTRPRSERPGSRRDGPEDRTRSAWRSGRPALTRY